MHPLPALAAAAWLRSHAIRAAAPEAIRADQRSTLARWIAQHGRLPVGRHFRVPADGPDLVRRWRAEVPATTLDDHLPLFERMLAGEPDILFPGRPTALAQTSGTTSAGAGERYIPQSRGLLAHHRLGGLCALGTAVAACGPRVLHGRLLMLGGATALGKGPGGVPTGDLSGITVSLIPRMLATLYEPGREIALDGDWPRKLARIVERCKDRDIRLVSGIGSWILVLFEAVCRARGVQRIADAWPNLHAVIHGGHAMGPLVPQLRAQLAPTTRLLEVYPASEGFFAVGSRTWTTDEDGPPELIPLTRHGIVLEFQPDGAPADQAVGAESLEAGQVYRLLATTPGGLVRLSPGDLVRGVGPGRFRFAGRSKTRISVFGEHVEGDALAEALAAACAATGAAARFVHVAPILPTAQEPRGCHEWLVEFDRAPSDAAAFIAAVDARLRAIVVDYAAHRTGDVQLTLPRLRTLPAGTVERWLAAKGKLGGQHKLPIAWPDRTIADGLVAAEL